MNRKKEIPLLVVAVRLRKSERVLSLAAIIFPVARLLSALLSAALFIIAFPCSQSYGESLPFLNEEFNSLVNWKPLNFPKIKSHTDYQTVKEGANAVLKLSSRASASALLLKKSFDICEFPVISWRWKIENIYQKGDGRKKKGDDYPVRIYIVFEYNPENIGIFKRAKYKMAKALYGKYPPDSTLSFVWANRSQGDAIFKSPYTDRAMIVPMNAAGTDLNEWKTHTVNIIEWYKKAFDEPPPKGNATLAVMNDSDNTGESSVSYIDFIRITK